MPDTPSEFVRLRVVQDNEGTDYDDISDTDFAIVAAGEQETVSISPVADATLYEDGSDTANGAGEHFFVGRAEDRNDGLERRAVLAFDIAGSIPAGSTITGVTLDLEVTRTRAGNQEIQIHSVTESWTEGSSDPGGQEGGGTAASAGDTTWAHRTFPNSQWSSEGGSFEPSPSGTFTAGEIGPATLDSTVGLVADVQGWLDDPSTNFGWLMRDPSSDAGTAKRFASRENGTSEDRPLLHVTFELTDDPLEADFEVSPESPVVGEPAQFNDRSAGAPTAWAWDFGDGGTSSDRNPMHTFQSAGDHVVTLTAFRGEDEDSTSATVTVQEAPAPDLVPTVIVPAAIRAPGDGGSFFVTTVDVHNSGAQTATFAFDWQPRGKANGNPARSVSFILEPGQTRRFDDLVGDVFSLENESGTATVVSDSLDLQVMTRVFNQLQSGTIGQSLPGVPVEELIMAGEHVRILFLTQNDDFRSNIGMISGVSFPIDVSWQIVDKEGTLLDTGNTRLKAFSSEQINRVLSDFAPIEAASMVLWSDTAGALLTCYGSVLDETTSDPTTILPY